MPTFPTNVATTLILSVRLMVLFLGLLVLQTCKDDDPTDGTLPEENETSLGQLTISDFIVVATQQIPSSGGEINISSTNTPVDGFKLISPADAYPDNKSYTISYANITKHDLGEDFNPISPLIRIENGGSYANELITLSIPIKLQEDHFAAAFMYNSQGDFELLPILESTSSEIKVVTNHFDYDKISKEKNKGGRINASFWSDIIVSQISLDKLENFEFTTDFKPGVDDWEFGNYGSYTSPGGVCSGMSVTALWYYENIKSENDGALFENKFLNGDKKGLWMDNSKGIKLVSMAQIEQGTLLEILILKLNTLVNTDKLSFYGLKYFLMINKTPMWIGLGNNDFYHAMLVNGVSKEGILIADPNLPGEQHPITYSEDEGFGDYTSGSDVYTEFVIVQSSSINSDESISKLWEQTQNGTIGKGCFIDYDLMVNYNDGPTLSSGINTFNGLKIVANCDSCKIENLFDSEGKSIKIDQNGVYQLRIGEQEVGAYITDIPKNPNCKEQRVSSEERRWADFKWVKVTNHELKITSNEGAPITSSGEAHEEYTFHANSTWKPKTNDKLVWNFGDGTPEVTIEDNNSVKHAYLNPGEYTLSLSIIDESNEILTTVETKCRIIFSEKDCMVTTITQGTLASPSSRTDIIEYDDKERLVKYIYSSFGGEFDQLEYDINNKLISQKFMSADGKIRSSHIFDYNNQGEWSIITTTNENGETTVLKAEYDGFGNRIKVISENFVYAFTYQDGNVTNVSMHPNPSGIIRSYSYFYDSSKANKTRSELGFRVSEIDRLTIEEYNLYVANHSKNIVNLIIEDGTSRVQNISYKFNGEGYPIEKNISGGDSNGDGVIDAHDTAVYKYEYNCK